MAASSERRWVLRTKPNVDAKPYWAGPGWTKRPILAQHFETREAAEREIRRNGWTGMRPVPVRPRRAAARPPKRIRDLYEEHRAIVNRSFGADGGARPSDPERLERVRQELDEYDMALAAPSLRRLEIHAESMRKAAALVESALPEPIARWRAVPETERAIIVEAVRHKGEVYFDAAEAAESVLGLAADGRCWAFNVVTVKA